MGKYCLIGHPLGHSVSPMIHSRLFSLSGESGEYTLRDIPAGGLAGAMDELRRLDGFNVTIPYKQEIIPLLDGLDEHARFYHAVNTVKCSGGRLSGFNTDADGFLNALSDAGIELKGQVLMCGAGGVAAMMAAEALKRGCSLTVATRTAGKAMKFISVLRRAFPDADVKPAALPYLSGRYDLILNGTPAGMYPDVNISPVPSAVARKAGAVFDAIYNPVETQLIKLARENGAKTAGGLRMLVWQAAAAQEVWTGVHSGTENVDAICSEMEDFITGRF